ncbi:NADPH-dependent FMN reductase [Tenacibaculum finnmarkense]|uniref:NADPH-dependent FMN reductase n=1 Tax=Tenacibaculum finnmarkense TaxID=2781243 RepID=UPI001E38AF0B|nr:NAD(P)H-dependent oxidoreductase [Tenacibaculum finnmarkense]MCD8413316.1 NAD(P)H-dependent oxidoreductase [Tenacibaculum finnmarkense genomovar ulcerans]MCG8207873.1 NAD(P)H-dependent oxidoreductase [Tenacibaculum finnmarkense genomovar finnmarkense]MCG8723957.1 NAD(P)H-dependent oxidoreductase [Tenacibaculum finnmarkense]MCG8742276.1 NAD(P)H-dependent oxidoreductase [Tenacibaculum finnmarkense]MCG8765665.1 NAD(P)H-dependent oxidoreductase [Tenacibaculum finnmarkense]
MKKIIAFAGSNSKKSINKELATYATTLVDNSVATVLDLNDFPIPVYGVDEETVNGIPENAQKFFDIIQSADGIILSLAEHNGNFSVEFKNMFDWMSRINQKLWNNIPMLLMATSPGARGGASVLSIAKNGFPHMGGNIIADFSLPSFFDNFKEGIIIDDELNTQLKEVVIKLKKSL